MLGKLSLIVLLILFPNCDGATNEQKVLDTIFMGYSTNVRPVRNHSQPIEVLLEMKLIQLLILNTRYESIRMFCWYNEIWHDDLLYWDPADFDGIDHIFVEEGAVWAPDTYIAEKYRILPYSGPGLLFGNLNMDIEESVRPQPIRIDTDPNKKRVSIKISYPCIYELSCKVDVEDFPNDIQTCRMTVYSWTRDASEITYVSEIPQTAYYMENLQWTLTNVSKEDRINIYKIKESEGDYVNVQWSEVVWSFEFQRRGGFFLVTLIVPTAILVQVCFLGIFTVSQSDGTRTEKVTLGITTILALSILLLVVGDILPRGSSPRPKISDYFVMEMVIMAGALIISVVLIYVQYYGATSGKPVPCCLRVLLCMCCSGKPEKKELVERQIMPLAISSTPVAVPEKTRSPSFSSNITSVSHTIDAYPRMLDEMRRIQTRVGQLNEVINHAMEEEEEEDDYADEWGKAVSRLEIFFLFLFSISSIVDTFFFVYNKPFTKPPYVQGM